MYAKGVSWIGDTRIPFVDDGDKNSACNKNHEQGKYNTDFFDGYFKRKGSNTKGRFTPNLLVCDDMLNDGSVSGNKDFIIQNKKDQIIYGAGKGFISKEKRFVKQDKGTNSRYYNLDLWFNKMVDEL